MFFISMCWKVDFWNRIIIYGRAGGWHPLAIPQKVVRKCIGIEWKLSGLLVGGKHISCHNGSNNAWQWVRANVRKPSGGLSYSKLEIRKWNLHFVISNMYVVCVNIRTYEDPCKHVLGEVVGTWKYTKFLNRHPHPHPSNVFVCTDRCELLDTCLYFPLDINFRNTERNCNVCDAFLHLLLCFRQLGVLYFEMKRTNNSEYFRLKSPAQKFVK